MHRARISFAARSVSTIACACAWAAAPVAAAGFDCAKASSRIEKSICADAGLSTLDEHLARYYAAARTELKEAAACLQDDQRRWLDRRNACADRTCLEATYLDRLAELDGLQPGATAIRHLELPARPALAWIVPPAADKVAAPPNPKAIPLAVSGALLNEVANGDGFVIRSQAGERHLLVMLMFLDPATSTQLEALARQPGVRFEARGYGIGGGRPAFEPSRCIFIHRVTATAAARMLGYP